MDTPQNLIVKFTYDPADFEQLDNFEDHLERAVTFHDIGTYEGYQLDAETGRNGEFYMTTTNGDLLFKTIRPLLMDASFLQVKQLLLQQVTSNGVQDVKQYEL